MAKGLEQVNAERSGQGRPRVADPGDHFHLLRAGARALRRVQGQASRALTRAEQAEARLAQARCQGHKQTGAATVAGRRWTPGLLDLKRLSWNCRAFRTGQRKGQTLYGLLGLARPTRDWWGLLKVPPEQLRQQLSAPRVAA